MLIISPSGTRVPEKASVVVEQNQNIDSTQGDDRRHDQDRCGPVFSGIYESSDWEERYPRSQPIDPAVATV
jgi:hypothetical protein